LEFEQNSMASFSNLDDFNRFYESLSIQGGWKIKSGLMNRRGEAIENTAYVHYLKKLFMKKDLFRRNVSIAEVVSFLDGYEFLSRTIKNLKEKLQQEVFEKIKVHIEYKIPYSKNRRIDYLFEYDNNILLTEFRLSSDFPNQGSTWHKKELELIVYKELLRNFILDKSIYLYALIGMPEYTHQAPIHKNILYNDNNIDFFADYLITFLIGDLRRPKEFNIARRD